MAEIVNLRRARKARDHAADEARAAENRAKYGQPKAAKDAAKAQAVRDAAKLEGHRREEP